VKIICVCPNSYAANTYLLVCDNNAIVVDPSISVAAIERALAEQKASLCGILLTHGHFDHTISVDTLRDKYDVPLMIHKSDACMLTNGRINGFFDFYAQECIHKAADKLFDSGDMIPLGNESIEVINTRGHSPGSSCFLCPHDEGGHFLISGDTLFSNTVGRCDLWGGNEQELLESLKGLKGLDPETTIYPGHGPSSKLGAALEIALYYVDF
jgi:glyoxylase-like metal-dependent hydrolase (beta-lactamase superfamily II)